MEKIEFKTDITWRSVALRVALVLGTVAIIVWFMPRDNKFNFKMEVDKVWLYNDLNAQFDFPVYKTDSLVQAERDEVLNDFAPYYVYRNPDPDPCCKYIYVHHYRDQVVLYHFYYHRHTPPFRKTPNIQ